MIDKFKEKFNIWLINRKFAQKVDMITKVGMTLETKYSKMSTAKIFKPSELELYNSINEANSLKRNIRNCINELNIFDKEIENLIEYIERIECSGIIECISIVNGYYKIGCLLDRKFVKPKYKIIIKGFNYIEFLAIMIIIVPLMYLLLRLLL